ncbi:MAG TPA: penicillin-binding protein [bacterium]|jgi:1A family penicillin-binding protein|nr:penicillin-binding protein [bacterium]HPX64515.1 penicillin-binding protein [bacterium]HQB26520.1 penicillin-binding protein [bacterium]
MPIPKLVVRKPSHTYTAYVNRTGHRSSSIVKSRQPNTRRPTRRRLNWPKIIKFFGALLILFLMISVFAFWWLSRDLPSPNKLLEREIAQSTKIYDRKGETILYEIHGDQKRTLVNLDQIPDHVKQATIAIEDKDFYNHGAFSLWAMFRTAVTNVLFHRRAGGSTLTQQFVKNALLTSEKTYTRKIKELILAYRIEKKFSKDEILQMYLNEIPYGSNAYGVEAASQRYFGKSISQVNLAEAAILAALPQAPTRYSPYGPNRDTLIARQRYILDLMAEQGYISKEEAAEAKDFPLQFKPLQENGNIIAPHFVMEIKGQLAEKYGEKMLEQGGLKIYSTIDLEKQKIAEEAVMTQAEKNVKNFGANNAALFSIDAKTGDILAMVGSRDYFNDDIDGQVNLTLRPRQPGSSFKPVVYATAFMKGYTPRTVLFDVVTNFSLDPDKPYEPHNYNGQEYGPVTMKKALAGSLNIPAVKTLYLAGLDDVLVMAKNLGYTTLNDKSRFGLSLVLGGGEVKLAEHVAAYSAFARDGEMVKPRYILKVEDKDGKILEETQPEHIKVLEPQIAREINDILSDNDERMYIFGAKNHLTLNDRPAAVKTGTTNDYKDAWTIGYTPSIITGVWVGNNDNKSMSKGADGSVVAAPIWQNYMNRILTGTPVETFKKPEIEDTGKPVLDGVIPTTTVVKVDKVSGLLATSSTPPDMIREDRYWQGHCILYYVDRENPRGPAPTNPGADPQFASWEAGVKSWAERQKLNLAEPPKDSDNLHIPENQPDLTIISPSPGQNISNHSLLVNATAIAPRGVKSFNIYINGFLLKTINGDSLNEVISLDFLPNGQHKIALEACDDVKNCTKHELTIILEGGDNINNLTMDWLSPGDGLTYRAADFPVALQLKITNFKLAHKIKVYYKIKGSSPQLITVVQPDDNGLANINFPQPAEGNGTYVITAEAELWTGEIVTSSGLTLLVRGL